MQKKSYHKIFTPVKRLVNKSFVTKNHIIHNFDPACNQANWDSQRL